MQVNPLLVFLVACLVGSAYAFPVSEQPSSTLVLCYRFTEPEGNITTDECLWGAGGGVDFIEYLNFFPGQYVEVPEPQDCYTYQNYCQDLGGSGGNSDQVQAILFIVGGFGSDAAMESAIDEFLNDVAGGIFVDDHIDIFGSDLVDCTLLVDNEDNDFCPNQCGDCGVSGNWYMFRSEECSDFQGCPSGQSNTQTQVRTVLSYSGDETLGESDSALTITQYWNFKGVGECTGTWDATYRFYSDASQCRINTMDVDESSCDVDCDSGVPSNLENVVCEDNNLLLTEDLESAVFSSDCTNYNYQNQVWREGDGGAGEFDDPPESPYPSSSSAGVLAAGAVGLVGGVVAMLA